MILKDEPGPSAMLRVNCRTLLNYIQNVKVCDATKAQ